MHFRLFVFIGALLLGWMGVARAEMKAEPGLAPIFVRVSFLEGTLGIPVKVQLTLRGSRLVPQEVKTGRTRKTWSVPFFSKARVCVVKLPRDVVLLSRQCVSFSGGELGRVKAVPITFLLGQKKEVFPPPKPKPLAEQLVSVSAQLNCVNGGFGKLRLEATLEGRTSPADIQCGESAQVALASAKAQGRICLTGVPSGIRLTSAQCADVIAGVTLAPVFSLERVAAAALPLSSAPTPLSQPPPQPSPPDACPNIEGTQTSVPSGLVKDSAGNCVASPPPPPPPPPQRVLSVSVSGSGSVASSPSGVSCPGDCTESYSSGIGVTLTATPASGWKPATWGGSCFGSTLSCSITMDSDRAVTVTFQEEVSGPPPEPKG